MELVKFDENSLLNFENNFKKSNNEILENVKIIDKELKEMDKILNTPNSSKQIPSYIDILENIEELIDKYNKSFENILQVVKNEYTEFITETKETVGEKNG